MGPVHAAGLADKVAGCQLACWWGLRAGGCGRGCMCMQAQKRYMEAAEKFGSMKDRVEGLLSTREDAYLGLLDVPHQGASLTPHTEMHIWMHETCLNAHSR